MATTIYEQAKKYQKIKDSGAFDVEDILTSVGWTDTIEPEFEKLINDYYKFLTEATLSSQDIEVYNPLTGTVGKVSPMELAARIEGLRFAKAFLERKLKEASKNRVPLGG